MDLALNNLQRLICHKTQTINQPSGKDIVIDPNPRVSNYLKVEKDLWLLPNLTIKKTIKNFFRVYRQKAVEYK